MTRIRKGKETTPHVGIFGRRNQGKSSLINALAGQEIAIVSDMAGTTTDPVKKSIEIAGIGPVILVDTAGIDDSGELGLKRVKRSLQILPTIDLALVVLADNHIDKPEEDLIAMLQEHAVPFILVHNKQDLAPLNPATQAKWQSQYGATVVTFQALGRHDTGELVHAIRHAIPESALTGPSLLGDLIDYGDVVLLITPIDIEAPEGRMILPQVQAIRDILDNDAVAVVMKEREVDAFIHRLQPRPALVITDSQVFLKADASIPRDIPLTSFSIMLARFKGDFENYLKGTPHISRLKSGDRILILESCTHHVSCDDIGRMKIPRWMTHFTGQDLQFDVVSGLSNIERDIHEYALVVQCGGCVLTRRQVISRLRPAVQAGVPVTNYGMAIAWMHGIYSRAIAPFVNTKASSTDYI